MRHGWAAAKPWRFAAIAPVAGRGVPVTACALKDMPVWAIHGDRDDVVTPEKSFAMARAIRACGGQLRLTIYPDLGHNSWDPAYDDRRFIPGCSPSDGRPRTRNKNDPLPR